jgi:hypothetical protein
MSVHGCGVDPYALLHSRPAREPRDAGTTTEPATILTAATIWDRPFPVPAATMPCVHAVHCTTARRRRRTCGGGSIGNTTHLG